MKGLRKWINLRGALDHGAVDAGLAIEDNMFIS